MPRAFVSAWIFRARAWTVERVLSCTPAWPFFSSDPPFASAGAGVAAVAASAPALTPALQPASTLGLAPASAMAPAPPSFFPANLLIRASTFFPTCVGRGAARGISLHCACPAVQRRTESAPLLCAFPQASSRAHPRLANRRGRQQAAALTLQAFVRQPLPAWARMRRRAALNRARHAQ